MFWSRSKRRIARKRYKPEEIVAKLRLVDVLVSQVQPVVDAVRSIGVTVVTYYRWRPEFGGPETDGVKRMTRSGNPAPSAGGEVRRGYAANARSASFLLHFHGSSSSSRNAGWAARRLPYREAFLRALAIDRPLDRK